MVMTAEISMYPFNPDYIPAIDEFIHQLHQHAGLKVQTFPTCTVVTGERDGVMTALNEAMAHSQRATGKAVYVVKFIPGYAAL